MDGHLHNCMKFIYLQLRIQLQEFIIISMVNGGHDLPSPVIVLTYNLHTYILTSVFTHFISFKLLF